MGLFHFLGGRKAKFVLIFAALLMVTAPLTGCGGCSPVEQMDDDDDDDDDDKKKKKSSSKSSSSKSSYKSSSKSSSKRK